MSVDSDQTAELVCDRINARVTAHNREINRGYELSLSVGATRSKAEGTMLADLLAQADTALYEQKRGRGRPAHALSR
jgi:GGDEF domain-containing protein